MVCEDQDIMCLWLLLVLFPFITLAQQSTNISLGSSLTAVNNKSFWQSPSGDFAFGFQEIVNDGFLLSIWFNKIPERTIIWSANKGNLVPGGSKIELESNGRLQLSDPEGNRVWNTNTVDGGVAYAAMLDTGNFVLADKDHLYVWQTFALPTDTILPTQTLDQPAKLVSRYLEKNYSSGRYQFVLQNDGNLVLYTVNYPTDSVNFAYWSTQTLGSDFKLIFNQTGSIYLRASNGTVVYTISSTAPPAKDFYHKATLEYDGIFRHYVYPKNSSVNMGKWPTSWSSVFLMPTDICSSIQENYGSGACGYNSYCKFDQRKICQCPAGYSFIDPNDVMKGCKQEFVPQSCSESFSDTQHFDFSEIQNTDWPLFDYERFLDMDEDTCRQACLADCFCAVVIFRNRGCWKKRLPLANGVTNSAFDGKALIKIRIENSSLSDYPMEDRSRPNIITAGWVLLSSSVFLILMFIVGVLLIFRSINRKYKMIHSCPLVASVNLINFTYEELRKATNEFKEEVGRGAFATVYKGTLYSESMKLIAVKKIFNTTGENEAEFEVEVSAIGKTTHRNLVQLIGFCNEGTHRILVYEYMSNGSLADFLFKEPRPNLYQRIQIAMGTARGLRYLHEECTRQIIHCDIKPQNILFDDIRTAKISDFGLAKLLRTDQTRTNTAIRGTKGYIAPEWFRNIPITAKVDVYSYGMLLLELICCRRNFEAESDDQMVLADWIYDCFRDRKLHLFVEDDDPVQDIKAVERLVKIALWCIQDDPCLRPSMNKVTQMLEGTVEVPIPPYRSYLSSV